MARKDAIKVQVYRSHYQDQKDKNQRGEYQEYEIPIGDRMSVFSVLDYIRDNYDRSLAFYKSCRIGRCSGCIVEIDGKNKLACTTPAKNDMKIGPAKGHEVIRDLVTEFPDKYSFVVGQDKYDTHDKYAFVGKAKLK